MKGLFAAVAALALGSSAFGGLVQFSTTNPAAAGISVDTTGGTASLINTTYNSATSAFTWNVTFSDGVAKNTRGFWLVVGPGPNPKGSDHEYAIMYFDASSLANPNVTVYRYNGVNGDTSFSTPGELLATTKLSGQTTIQNVTASTNGGARSFSFGINAASINAAYGAPGFPDWKGIQFGSQIGIWFHPVTTLATTYNNKGGLTKFDYYTEGYYDGQNNNTTPSPASVAVLGLGGLVASRRRRA